MTNIPISDQPPPPLIPDEPSSGIGGAEADEGPTNTLALLLPHLSLFSPPILDLLRAHYESYGVIAHWAPVKGFGRVIVVYETVEAADEAKEKGDRLFLDVDVDVEQGEGQGREGYFRTKRKKG